MKIRPSAVRTAEGAPSRTLARGGIMAGGNWIVDHVKVIDRWPSQDALASILDESSSNGGSPYNVLKNLSRLGAGFPLEAVGLVGDDSNGRLILDDCRAHGIDTAQLRSTRAAATSYTDVMTVQDGGRRTFFHRRGANALLDATHFDFRSTRAKILHLGYLLLLDRLDAPDAAGGVQAAGVLAAARAAGLATSIDVVSEQSDRFSQVVLPVLPHVDLLFVNDFEAERLTGIALRRAGKIQAPAVGQAARRLLEAGVGAWVFLHFPEGVYACGAGGVGHWQPAFRLPPERIKGAAGAGDALAAGILYSLHEHWPIAKALQLGTCVAAASLGHPTCSEGVGPLQACLEFGQGLTLQTLPAGVRKAR